MRFDSPSNFGPAHFATTGADLDFDDIDAVAQPQPTEGQMKFIGDLREAWQLAELELSVLKNRAPRCPAWVDPASREEASAMIDRGKDAREAIRAELTEARRAHREAARAATTEVTEGMWIIGEVGNDEAKIYKVQIAVHGSGRPYAKLLTTDGFEYAAGALREIGQHGRKMTLDEAKAYGKLYGVCCKCGATLTDENSIAAGIGPVCAQKF